MTAGSLAALLLLGCPKERPTSPVVPPEQPAAPTQSTGPSTPDGWTYDAFPTGVRDIHIVDSLLMDDGTLVLAGSVVKVAQYQWMMRQLPLSEPVQHVYDPGRIQAIAPNQGGGIDAVGALGGVPQEHAWYGDVDAFGNIATRQTYMNQGEGVLRGAIRADEGLRLVGVLTHDGDATQGWIIHADSAGRDQRRTQYGDAPRQGFHGAVARGDNLAAVGFQSDTTDDPWVVEVDPEGTVVMEHRWREPAWTTLRSAANLADGDLMVVGISAQRQADALDGLASVWLARVGADGTSRWDRQERSDVSYVSSATGWGDGVAVAVLTGGVGTTRGAVVGRISEDGKASWTDIAMPDGVDWLGLHTRQGVLTLVAVIVGEEGLAWHTFPLEGGAAAP